jgi:hypothetical protein
MKKNKHAYFPEYGIDEYVTTAKYKSIKKSIEYIKSFGVEIWNIDWTKVDDSITTVMYLT